MSDRVVVDTDVLSRMYRQDIPNELRPHLNGKLFISFATYGEIWKGVEYKQWRLSQALALFRFIKKDFSVIPGSKEVARQWGLLAGAAKRNGRMLPINDSWIAASCLAWELPIVTFNRKDYERVPGLELRG